MLCAHKRRIIHISIQGKSENYVKIRWFGVKICITLCIIAICSVTRPPEALGKYKIIISEHD